MSDARNQFRAATLGKAGKKRSVIIEVQGLKVEVRRPSIAKRTAILKAGGSDPKNIDWGKLQIEALLQCVFIPGTEEHAFERADEAVLADADPEDFDEAYQVAMKLLSVDREAIEKNSERIPSESSSS